MLELFKDEIPNLDSLIEELRHALVDPTRDLEDIREIIYDHIIENIETESEKEMEDKANEAMTIAFNAIDDIINELDVNETNFHRLKEYIEGHDSYNAYNRLIMDFDEYLSEDERLDLINKGRGIFIKEVTEDWE